MTRVNTDVLYLFYIAPQHGMELWHRFMELMRDGLDAFLADDCSDESLYELGCYVHSVLIEIKSGAVTIEQGTDKLCKWGLRAVDCYCSEAAECN